MSCQHCERLTTETCMLLVVFVSKALPTRTYSVLHELLLTEKFNQSSLRGAMAWPDKISIYELRTIYDLMLMTARVGFALAK